MKLQAGYVEVKFVINTALRVFTVMCDFLEVHTLFIREKILSADATLKLVSHVPHITSLSEVVFFKNGYFICNALFKEHFRFGILFTNSYQ